MEQIVEQNLRKTIKEFNQIYKNIEKLEMQRIRLEKELEKIDDELDAFSRDEQNHAKDINLIYEQLSEEDRKLFIKIISPALLDIGITEAFRNDE